MVARGTGDVEIIESRRALCDGVRAAGWSRPPRFRALLRVFHLGHEHGQEIAVEKPSRRPYHRNKNDVVETGARPGRRRVISGRRSPETARRPRACFYRPDLRQETSLSEHPCRSRATRANEVFWSLLKKTPSATSSPRSASQFGETPKTAGDALRSRYLNVDVERILHLGDGLDLRQLGGNGLRVIEA